MTGVGVLLGLLAVVALLVIGVVLVRRPRTRPLYALAGLFAFGVLAWLASAIASGALDVPGPDRLDGRVAENLCRMAATYCLFVFTFTALPGIASRAAELWHGAVFLLAAIGVVGAAGSVPLPLRDVAAGGVGGQGQAAVVLVSLCADLYFVIAYGTAWWWVARHRRDAGVLRRRALPLSAGLALIVAAALMLATDDVVRWAGAVPPPALSSVAAVLVLVGSTTFVVGLVLVLTRGLVARRRGRRAQTALHRQLEPLWLELNRVFPDDALGPDPTAGRWSRRSRGQWAFHRRVIECRDGLVRLSPFLSTRPGESPSGCDLWRALALAREARVPAGAAKVVAAPDETGLLEEARSMAELARRLRDSAPAGAHAR
ncbi:MAB_1171c family putative transporter [Actinomycetospora sp. OC33-EN08]|uniref:MAB_1171c family putative transporter n=1 Tax=Actinomycetospora aurantiaca TaxID=3129233 RepID=A0ABU8MVJ6_9PSEU